MTKVVQKIRNSKIQKSNFSKILIISLFAACLSMFFIFEARAGFGRKTEIEKCRELYNQKTPKSWEKAYESTCSDLAFNGNGEAQYYIGMIIKNSPKIPDYKAQAYSFFYVANENGEKRAKGEMEKITEIGIAYHILANIYDTRIINSNMIKKDDKKSLFFLEKSSKLGNKFSQSSLASVLALGISGDYKFPSNLVQAYKWSYLSIQDNIGFFPDSIKDLNQEKQTAQKVFSKIKSMCNKSQILEGERLAKEWIKNNPVHFKNSKINQSNNN